MLTLTQLYDLATHEGIDLFGGLNLPSGSSLNREILINSILIRCGLNIPNFADPSVMASAISIWSAKNQYTFEHVDKIYKAQYSPIENYDRYEDMNSTTDHTLKDDTDNTGTKTDSTIANKTSKHTGTDTTTDESKTSAYDSSTYQPESKVTSDLQHGETITDNGGSTKTITNNLHTNKLAADNEKTTQNNHIRGNIGVTTAPSMQVEDYEFVKNYNPYEFLSGLFENELTLYVY